MHGFKAILRRERMLVYTREQCVAKVYDGTCPLWALPPRSKVRDYDEGSRWGKVGWPIQLAHAAAASHRAFGASQPSTSQPFPSRRPGQGQAGGIRCCTASLLDSFPPTPAKAPLIRHAVGKSHRQRCLLEKCSSIQEFPQRLVGWLVGWMVGGHAA